VISIDWIFLHMNAIQYDHDELTDFLSWEEQRPENSIGQMPFMLVCAEEP
jgi:hypothetical protein